MTTTELEQTEPIGDVMTLPKLVGLLDNGEDIDVLTAIVVTAVLEQYQHIADGILRSPVRDAIRRARRAAARHAEDEAFSPPPPTPAIGPGEPQEPAAPPASGHQDQAGAKPAAASTEPVTTYEADPLAPYRELRTATFWVPGHGPVSWSEATEADHLARASWCRGQAAAQVVDAERHEQAAAIIRQHGGGTLGDIDGF